ncbi:hypothetical protein AL013_10485 [Mariprofundus ferrooxydans]|nr:DUF2730 family protein [Mariprofundus ferrooxydans]KON47009.1 hypothetical protein AL013_10485 [Mariprofundus ferrooxydans]
MDANFWLAVLRDVLTGAVYLYVFFSNRRKATTKNIEDMKAHVAEQQKLNDKRLTMLESDIKHLPTHTDLDSINKTLSNVEGTLGGLKRAVDLMNQHLLNSKGKA